MFDTHCHLTFPEFRGRVAEELELAAGSGVQGLITISTTVPDAEESLAIARAHDRVWCAAGVHPLYADQGPHDWDALSRVASDPRCVAWGELGLDHHYPKPARELQEAVLEEQLDCIEHHAKAGTIVKPIVVHCREAYAALVPRLARRSIPPSRYVFHCFTGTPDDARIALDFGALISFTGVATYRNAQGVRDAARLVPHDRIMVETDAPFLSPEPRRGERPCRPWMVRLTGQRLAKELGLDESRFEAITDANARRFFGLA